MPKDPMKVRNEQCPIKWVEVKLRIAGFLCRVIHVPKCFPWEGPGQPFVQTLGNRKSQI